MFIHENRGFWDFFVKKKNIQKLCLN